MVLNSFLEPLSQLPRMGVAIPTHRLVLGTGLLVHKAESKDSLDFATDFAVTYLPPPIQLLSLGHSQEHPGCRFEGTPVAITHRKEVAKPKLRGTVL